MNAILTALIAFLVLVWAVFAGHMDWLIMPASVQAGRGVSYVPSSVIRVWLDPETGCEYFADSGAPRFKADGKQLCSAEGATEP